MGKLLRASRSTLLVLICLALSGCMADRYVREGLWIVDDYVRTMRNEHELRLCKQSGPRWNKERLSELKLHFKGWSTMDRRQARRLAVLATEELLKSFNSNRVAHPAGPGRPVTTHNINLTIEFDTFFGELISPRSIRYVNVKDGYVTFYCFDCVSSSCDCTVFREPYEEAFRTVQKIIELEEREEANEEAEEDRDRTHDFGSEWGIPLN